MARKFIYVLFAYGLICCYGCQKEKSISRKEIRVTRLLADSLSLSFPGDLRISSEHIILGTPFTTEGFLKIYDRKTWHELDWTGMVGNGPSEWIMPKSGNVLNDKILIYDMNMRKYIIADANNLRNDLSNIDLMNKLSINAHSLSFISENHLIAAVFEDDAPFKIIHNGNIIPAGKYPIKEKITNTSDCMQGNIAIHNNLLLYAMLDNPYIALYNINENSLDLVWENQLEKLDYSITEGNLHWNEHGLGFSEITFTKDYIVCQKADHVNKEKTVKIFARGREMPLAFRSIYVFDYKGRLLHILDPEIHTLRLSSDINSNNLYTICAYPDYSIVQFDLDEILLQK
jgi:hypothetical protein